MMEILKEIGITLLLCFVALGIMILISWTIDKVCKKAGWDYYRIFDGFLRLFMYIGGVGFGIFGIAVLAMIGRSV